MRTGWAAWVAFRAAWACLRQHRWRSLLTLVLCGLGTAGVILAGTMARVHVADIQARLRMLGGGLLIVSPNQVPPHPGRTRQLQHFISLTPEDGAALAAELPQVQQAVPAAVRNTTVQLGGMALRVRLVGTTPE